MSRAQTCIYDTDSCRYAKYEFGEPDTSKCKDCNRNPNIKENKKEGLLAEEYICNGKCQDDITKNYVHCKTCTRLNDFLAGFKAGKPKWHDLKKNPNDLPPMIEDERKISNMVWLHIHNWGTEEAYYDYRKCSWIVRCRIVNLDVIAWCEIPEFMEE